MAEPRHRPHEHQGAHFDEADWERLAASIEAEGELLIAFVTDTAGWIDELRGPDAPPVRRVLDIGSGPGVGTCELARAFPKAHVLAVDGAPAMLERATRRAASMGLDHRVTTHLAELPDGLSGLDSADLIWASMSLHHVADETAALRLLRALLEPAGLLAVTEMADPMRLLTDDLDVGQPGLADRLERAERAWFTQMRADLSGGATATPLEAALESAGLEIVGSRLARVRLDPPLSYRARRFAADRLRGLRHRLEATLDPDDLQAVDVLSTPEDPRSVMHRADVFVDSSRQVVIARRRPA